jgi:heme a synthase
MLKLFVNLARLGTILALIVVTVGAWVRLTDAGLGCPDWPGCYGQLVVPDALPAHVANDTAFKDRPLEPAKAWNEMIHRYLASTLGLICVGLGLIAWRNRRDPRQPTKIPAVLVGLIVLQGLLGMWTVTLLLKPLIVVAHLVGGFSTLALLFWLGRFRTAPIWSNGVLKLLAVAATIVVAGQIMLGGWTSANYAALACPDFPTCQTQWWPQIADFDEAFVLWRGLGIDYEGGVLDHPARVAIHFSHRLGALITALVVGAFALRLSLQPSSRADGLLIFAALAMQIAIGISIVVFGVPLAVAVAHNGVAAILLLTLINAHHRIWQR